VRVTSRKNGELKSGEMISLSQRSWIFSLSPVRSVNSLRDFLLMDSDPEKSRQDAAQSVSGKRCGRDRNTARAALAEEFLKRTFSVCAAGS